METGDIKRVSLEIEREFTCQTVGQEKQYPTDCLGANVLLLPCKTEKDCMIYYDLVFRLPAISFGMYCKTTKLFVTISEYLAGH